MTMLAFVLLGLLIGFFRAGGISGLARIPLRAPWLIAVSLLLQAAIAVGGPRFPDLYNAYILYLQAARFLPLLLFALLNVRVWQVALAGVGVATSASTAAEAAAARALIEAGRVMGTSSKQGLAADKTG